MQRPARSLAACIVMACTLMAPAIATPLPAGSRFEREECSYPFGAGLVTLDHDSSRIAVLLDAQLEDERAVIEAIAGQFNELESIEDRDRQGYRHLWLVRVREGTSAARVRELLDAVDTIADVRFASPVFRYDTALVIPKPEIMIAFADNQLQESQRLQQELSLERIAEIPGLQTTFHFRVPASARSMFALTTDLSRRPGVRHVTPNFILKLKPHNTPNDVRFANQWHHDNTGQTGGTIGADLNSVAAWNTSTGNPAVVIAIIDGGVDMDHEDLAANIVGGHDTTDQPWPEGVAGNALPADGHGTSCAGIAAGVGNNGIGGAGVCWSAGILAVRIGYSDYWTEDAWAAGGITWAADNGADVLSNSWGGGPPSATLQSAIQYAKTTGRGGLGCPVLFSSGNDDAATVGYPARYPETIAVGASSPCDERKNSASCDGEVWWGSNYGPELTLVVPGVLIDTTDIMGSDGYASGNYLTNFNGTSSACPNAAGSAALLLSVLPGLTAGNVQSYLEQACDDQVGPAAEDTPGFDNFMGWGRLNLATLMFLTGGPLPPTNLTCSELSGDTSLTWSNPQTYDSIVVRRDSTDLATLSGSATSYLDINPGVGTYEYSVRGVVSGTDGIGTMCVLFHDGGATDLVWKPAGNAGAVDGGQGLVDALTANSRVAIEVADLSLIPDLNVYDRVWVSLGIYPNNHVLTALDSNLLENYLIDGIGGETLYLEGGDTWAFDTATSLHILFDVDGVADGSGDYSTAIGSGNTTCDLTGIDLAYGGENEWIDHLSPLGAAWTIQSNDTPAYDTAVYNETASYVTIGASHEFAGFTDGASTKADLMAAYLSCFGFTGNVAPVTGLSCTETGDDALLAWTNGDSYTAIEIVRDSTVLATLLGTATSYLDVSPPGGNHTYDVIAYDGITASPATSCALDITPDAVASLACAVTPSSVDLTWNNSESYGAIEVRRDGSLIASLGGGASSYSDTAPLSGVHTYAVRSIIGTVNSADSSCSPNYVAPPAIVSHPASAAECPGAAIVLSVTASGDALAYQWRKNSTDIPGANTDSYTLGAIVASDAGDYDVVVSNSAGTVPSNVATVTVFEPPTITANPTSATQCPGAAVSFSIAATGEGVSYQWRKDSGTISGATAATLSLTSITGSDAGSYDCVVNGTCGSTTSSAATLSVLAPPSLLGQPASVTDCPGSNVTLVVTATGDGLAYQWRKDTTSIPGATTSSLSLSAITAGDAGEYDCTITGLCGTATSNSATVTVLLPPSIVAQPNSATECDGTPITFTTSALGDGLSYQWYKDGALIGGATTTSVSIAAAIATDAGNYHCVVTGLCGSATSTVATLTVLAAPAITSQPAGATKCSGETLTLSVAATGDGLLYQWRKNGTAIGGAISPTLTVAALAATDAGSYDCLITGTCGSETTSAVLVTVLEPPTIVSQPSGATDCPGTSITFATTASGAGLAYQWRKNGSPVSGATGSSLSILSISAADAGSYDCVITGACGSATSNAALLTVLTAPSITSSPSDATDCPGATVSFVVGAAGDGLGYQWRKGGVAIGGATGPSYTLGTIAAADAGSYDCVVSGTCGNTTSSAATLTVLPAPSVTANPVGTMACPGATASFSVSASGAGLSYQWRKDGVSLTGAVTSSLTLMPVAPVHAGSYDCVVTGTCGIAISTPAALIVNDPPLVTSNPVGATDCPGASVTFTCAATGDGVTFQWRKDGTSIAGATSDTFTIASIVASDAASYDCFVSGTCGDVSTSAATLNVLAVPSIVTAPASQAAGVADTVTFSVVAAGAAPLSYQWHFEGAPISGATSDALTITGVTSGDAGNYHIVVSNACDSATSGVASLTVGAIPSVTGVTCCATDETVEICWVSPIAYDSYRIERGGVEIATVPTGTTCYSDSGLAAGSYDYSVTGQVLSDESGAAPCSATVISSVIGVGCVIENPTFATPDVALSWTNPGGYDAIEIHRDDISIAIVSGSDTAYFDLGVTPGGHTYRVTGTFSGGSCVSLSGGVECSITLPTPIGFLRGDANDDAAINIADVVFLLGWIFQSGADPHCFDGADSNDDGTVDLADGIYMLNYIFTEGPQPPEPFGTVGPDPTDDSLGCVSSTSS